MKGFNVLIIEDDTIILHSLKRLLESKGLNIFINQTGENVIQQLVDMHLIIMDIMLPYDNGLSITQDIRKFSNIPIIFMSARNDIDTKLQGLSNGEDYITKPFHPLELIARVQNLLDKHYIDDVTTFHNFKIDTVNHIIYDASDEVIKLTKTEHKLFFYLFSNLNTVLTKEQLFDYIWFDEDKFDNLLNTYIKRLRSKLQDHDAKIIKTIYGIGYRMVSHEE
ncbi:MULTISPECIES: response regulator transcription factor [Macrococcus]|uniref:Response regulator transcription factor n=1 Tax=Macrococcus psychrotolerans TaxID=3039389 RepID=A0AAT9P5Q6_9STAP|nr:MULTISPECIES: response regulator transcription factor [Macrococcus]MDJ1112454.1 response regulator transcription factor [Macrococcus sp. S115]QYA32587.1 response regulator transcription factor [Macrococcus sp. 19Msa1099]QYA37398.1 response regulator transcription factor [Macrococcus caseolyticus]QYA76105.1 response regulator transcription factor [Macrococcus caseolyticus]